MYLIQTTRKYYSPPIDSIRQRDEYKNQIGFLSGWVSTDRAKS